MEVDCVNQSAASVRNDYGVEILVLIVWIKFKISFV